MLKQIGTYLDKMGFHLVPVGIKNHNSISLLCNRRESKFYMLWSYKQTNVKWNTHRIVLKYIMKQVKNRDTLIMPPIICKLFLRNIHLKLL